MATTVNQGFSSDNRDTSEENAVNTLFSRVFTLNWYTIIFLAIFFLAMFTRFYELGERVMSHDESLHTQYSYNLYQDGQFDHTPLMHGPILFHFTALSYYLFGDNDFSARIYAAVVGVMLVMSPLFFRRWLGRWGTILAALMLLASPLLTYYSRYIRHDMPSIFSAVLMAWGIMMYLSGPENQRRRAHWLYIISAAMIWNLGSKETAFIYIAIFGLFLTIYWVVRLLQYFYGVHGKPLFEMIMIGLSLAGVFSLFMIITVSVGLGNNAITGGETLSERMTFIGDQIGVLLNGDAVSIDFATFLSWTGLTFVFLLAVIIGTGMWVFRKRDTSLQPPDAIMIVVMALLVWALSILTSLAVALIAVFSLGLLYGAFRFRYFSPFLRPVLVLFGITLVFGAGLLIFEEVSHEPSRADSAEVQQQPVPGESTETVVVESDFTLVPIAGVWILGFVIVGGLLYTKVATNLWDILDQFPEFDVLIVMGSLVLPWLTAFFIYATNPDSIAYADIANSLPTFLYNLIPTGAVGQDIEAARVGRVLIGTLAWIPMMSIAVVAGLVWNWRRWIISAAIFHIIFAFFFTTIFTNIEGLATGMIYSLEYWLEQQGVRRGSQPQYYYLLLILPMYEFLPIIGGFLAMLGGMVVFWRRRRTFEERHLEFAEATEDSTNGLDIPIESTNAEDVDDEMDAEPPPVKREVDPRWRLDKVPFLLFVGFWAVLNLYAYTLSGEKMPWLGTHMTVPMILLTAWYFGDIIERISWRTLVERRGWIYVVLLPLGLVVLFQIIAPFFGNEAPFQGTARVYQTWTYQWLAVVFVGAIVLFAILRLVEHTGWANLRRMFGVAVFVLLAVITFRSSWLASFINYDEATEFLVYAHGGPGNEIVFDTLTDLSVRTTGGMNIAFGYDDGMSWPGSWYFRDFNNGLFYHSNPTLRQVEDLAVVVVRDDGRAEVEPLLEDRFIRFDYTRMWWPMQDYYNLTADRMNNLFDIAPSNDRAAATRRGIFDIWWSRDYDRYEEAIGKPDEFSLENWPVRDLVHMYVRRDIAAQVWSYGVGEGSPLTVFNQVEENLCLANWQQLSADVVFDRTQINLVRPIGLDVTDDGLVYVAEEGNTSTGEAMRISVFDVNGNYLQSFGQRGTNGDNGAFFERPHSVAVSPDGTIYVADTWNYLIRGFNLDFTPVVTWGQPFSAGIDAPQEPVTGFWGPRDVVVDNNGRVYVADTGNKRIRVYTGDGQFLLDIGTGGSGPGQLDEPAGIAVHPDGRVFVADTWNRRVSVFNADGAYTMSFDVRGWASEPIGRPYLAVDAERDIVYVTDPDVGRVLVYDTQGNCVGAFGQFNAEFPDSTQFSGLGGIAVDQNGNVYVADTASGRILRFAPFPLPIPSEAVPEEGVNDGGAPVVVDPLQGGAVDALADQIEVTDEPIPPDDSNAIELDIPEATDEPEVTDEVSD